MIGETKPGRTFRAIDPGSADVLPIVEMSDDGATWRVTPNYNRRALGHYRIHRGMPPGFDSGTWPKVKPRFDAVLAAEGGAPEPAGILAPQPTIICADDPEAAWRRAIEGVDPAQASKDRLASVAAARSREHE